MEQSPWLPASPSLSDIALSYFLGEQTTPRLQQLLVGSSSALLNNLPTRYCDLSDSGQKKLAGMDETSARTLLLSILDYAYTANDGLVLVVCIRLANAVLDATGRLK